MKKFLYYSIVATLFIVVFGTLFIFGMFDLGLNQVSLVGSGNSGANIVESHNSIVENIQKIAIYSKNSNKILNELTPDQGLDSLKNEIKNIEEKKAKLLSVFNQFTKIESETTEEFNNKYLPVLDDWINTNLKAISYFDEKELSEDSINSFKGVVDLSYEEFTKVHNSFIELLNSHKH
ncbi:hypothetical protein ACFLZH_02800 [Patescibacteria group bacterium]